MSQKGAAVDAGRLLGGLLVLDHTDLPRWAPPLEGLSLYVDWKSYAKAETKARSPLALKQIKSQAGWKQAQEEIKSPF
jgi:hypothetical protein